MVVGSFQNEHCRRKIVGHVFHASDSYVLRCSKHTAEDSSCVIQAGFYFVAVLYVVYPFVHNLARDGMVSYCDMQPSEKIMRSFKKRGDNQITSLEILSIALGKYKYN